MRHLLLLAGLGAALGAVAPAQAQNFQDRYRPTGTRIVSQAEQVEVRDSRELVKLTAACVVRRYPDDVVALLRSGHPEAFAYAAEGIRDMDVQTPLSLSACVHEALNGTQVTMEMRIPERELRLALAEEAYLRREAGPLAIAEGSPQFLAGRPVMLGSTPEQAVAMGQFADCLVFHAPAQADAMLRGPVGGDAESEAARAMVPAIGQCLPQGQDITFTPSAIRNYVVDGLWARSEALVAQGSGE